MIPLGTEDLAQDRVVGLLDSLQNPVLVNKCREWMVRFRRQRCVYLGANVEAREIPTSDGDQPLNGALALNRAA